MALPMILLFVRYASLVYACALFVKEWRKRTHEYAKRKDVLYLIILRSLAPNVGSAFVIVLLTFCATANTTVMQNYVFIDFDTIVHR